MSDLTTHPLWCEILEGRRKLNDLLVDVVIQSLFDCSALLGGTLTLTLTVGELTVQCYK